MHVAFDVRETVVFVVVHRVVIVHDGGGLGEQLQNLVLVQPILVFLLMGAVIGQLLVAVEAQTPTTLADHNNRVVPIYEWEFAHFLAQRTVEWLKPLSGDALLFGDIAIAGAYLTVGETP